MTSEIDLNSIQDKNLSFLIGSGASVGLVPTLKVKVKASEMNALIRSSL